MIPVPNEVSGVFERYSPDVCKRLIELRRLIFRVAKNEPKVGAIEEALRWGQPSYLTSESGSGSTIRIDGLRSRPGWYAMYFHCQTTLVASFRERYGHRLKYEGNRALLFKADEDLPTAIMEECVRAALTYHSSRRGARVPIGSQIK